MKLDNASGTQLAGFFWLPRRFNQGFVALGNAPRVTMFDKTFTSYALSIHGNEGDNLLVKQTCQHDEGMWEHIFAYRWIEGKWVFIEFRRETEDGTTWRFTIKAGGTITPEGTGVLVASEADNHALIQIGIDCGFNMLASLLTTTSN